jgi:hypothetical protein
VLGLSQCGCSNMLFATSSVFPNLVSYTTTDFMNESPCVAVVTIL